MHYPLSGTDGGLDFGTIRVNEERKETCTLKNKGKYEITFKSVHVAPRCRVKLWNDPSVWLWTVCLLGAVISSLDAVSAACKVCKV